MPTKVVLTDRYLKALKPAPAGKRVTVWDAVQPHLGVRITDRGRCSFVVVKRQSGDPRPTRHFLGSYPALSLADARAATPEILSSLMKGESPKELEQARLARVRQAREQTFDLLVEDFIKRHVSKLRSHRSTELIIKRELLGMSLRRNRSGGKWIDEWIAKPDARWRGREVAKIFRRDVVELLEKISDAGSRHQARKVFAILSKMFNWALVRDSFQLDVNPIARIRCTDLLGQFPPRSRILTDDELRMVWTASQQVGYPFGPLVRLLMLTGQRLRELSNASWGEFTPATDMLIVPPSRMKGKCFHHVPMPSKAQELLAELPRFTTDGNPGQRFVFTTTHGKRPFSGFAKAKANLDKEIAAHGSVPHWTLHDLRRTVRTRLSGLVMPLVAELVIGHKQTGIQATYDLHTYDREKFAALSLWQDQLLKIVEGGVPTLNNVVTFPAFGAGGMAIGTNSNFSSEDKYLG